MVTISFEHLVENITKSTLELQNQRLRFFAKVDITVRLKILRYQKSQFHKLKTKYVDIENEILTFASLVLGIQQAMNEMDNLDMNVAKTRGKISRRKTKRDKLLTYFAIINELKTEKQMSFREIAKYLQKYHKFEVAHSTIHDLWIEVTTNTLL